MANRITLIRIVTLPLLVYFLTREETLWVWLSLCTFLTLAATDWLDGYVARRMNQVTGTGQLLDPIADKLLIMAAIFPLVARHDVPAWMGIVILGREFTINGLRMVALADHKIIAAGTWGKWKTGFYIAGIGFVIGAPALPGIFPPQQLHLVGLWLLVAGMVLAVVSALDYFRHYQAWRVSRSATDVAG